MKPGRFDPTRYLLAPDIDLHGGRIQAFEGIWETIDARFAANPIECTCPFPKFEFLTYLVQRKNVLLIPPAGASRTLGAFDAAVDLLIFVAPALAMLAHQQLGRTAPLFLIAGLPAGLAWPVALRMGETRADRFASSQRIE